MEIVRAHRAENLFDTGLLFEDTESEKELKKLVLWKSKQCFRTIEETEEPKEFMEKGDELMERLLLEGRIADKSTQNEFRIWAAECDTLPKMAKRREEARQ